VSVNEADVGRIVPGAPVTFACDAFPGREFTGSVGKVRLNATMTQNVVMYTVEVNTENPDNVLLPYLTANVRFIAKKESQTLLVPNAALRWSPSSLAQVAPDARARKSAGPGQADPPGDLKPSTPDKSPGQSHGVIWLTDGNFIRPVEVKVGITDGAETAVATTELQEGQEAIIGEAVDASQAATLNPFLPPIRKR
jgi:HlyD family secretion protein